MAQTQKKQSKKNAKKQINTQSDTKSKTYNVTKVRGALDTKRIMNKLKESFNPTTTLLINMELLNGNHIQFTTQIKGDSFFYNSGRYIIDNDLKYYNMSASLWCLDYHEQISFPIKREIPVKKIKDSLKNANADVVISLNPRSLQEYIKSEFVQKVMQGESLSKLMNFLKIMSILSVLGIGAILVIILQQSGVLAQFGL